MSELLIRRLSDPDDPAMGPLERIYLEALPGPERKPVERLRAIIGPVPEVVAGYEVLVAELDKTVVGFAILFLPSSPHDAALLEYLAVDKSARGGGVGGTLLRYAIAISARPMLVELETGDPCADRRRRFYERHRCRAVMGLQYLLPLPGAGPMQLLIAGATSVSRSDLLRWIATVYRDVYDQPRDDPRLAVMANDIRMATIFGASFTPA